MGLIQESLHEVLWPVPHSRLNHTTVITPSGFKLWLMSLPPQKGLFSNPNKGFQSQGGWSPSAVMNYCILQRVF